MSHQTSIVNAMVLCLSLHAPQVISIEITKHNIMQKQHCMAALGLQFSGSIHLGKIPVG